MLADLPAASLPGVHLLSTNVSALCTHLGGISTRVSAEDLTPDMLHSCLATARLPISGCEIGHSIVIPAFSLFYATLEPSSANAVTSAFTRYPELHHFSLLLPLLGQPLSPLTQIICEALLPGLSVPKHVHPQSVPQTASKGVL